MRAANRIRRAAVEGLEPRLMLAGNIHVTDAYLTDLSFNRLEGPPAVGEQYGIRVDFATTDLPAGAQFQVLYRVNGVNLTGSLVETGVTWNGRFGYFAGTGQTDIRVKVDPAAVVSETNETDNEMTFSFTSAEPSPPHKMVLPVGGVPQKDWAVTAYADLNPLPGVFADYRGRQYTFDGNEALNIAASDFAGMDAGVDVVAAMPGTILEVHDGEFDRQYALFNPPPPNTPDNFVLIDHGNGWRTRYGKLRNGSVTVAPGQVVTTGQKLGLIGGSGNPSPAGYAQPDPFLRFELTHDGRRIETFLAPDAYWQSPPPFASDAPAVFYMTTINEEFVPVELEDRLPRRKVFQRGERVFVYTSWHGLNREAVRQYRYIRPDGTEFTDAPNTGQRDLAWATRGGWYQLAPADPLGEWQVAAMLNGVELGRTSFTVADRAQGLPEIKVYQGSTYIVDGRTTPIDFGNPIKGTGPRRLAFAVRNYGMQPLTLDGLSLPDGFSLVGALPTPIPALNTRTVTIQLDDLVAGAKGGRVVIRTNDADQGEFDFAVKGTVAGIPAAVEQVFVGGSGWGASFRTHLQAQGLGGAPGFALPTAAGAASPPLPWANLDTITLRFNTDVQVRQQDLAVRGVSVAEYPVGGFVYDPSQRTATWTLGRSLANDRVALALGAGVTGAAAAFAVNVLPGDVDRSGAVLADDFSSVKQNFFATPSTPAYSVFHDVDGSGSILADDFSEVRRRFFQTLPQVPAVAAPAATRAKSVARDLFDDVPVLP